MTGTEPTAEQRFAVASRMVVFYGGSALFVLSVVAILSGRVALGITGAVIVFLAVMGRGLVWNVVRARRKLAKQEKAQVPQAPVSAAAGPVPVDQVVGDLIGMNSDGLPFLIEAERIGDGVLVEVRWKSEEMRWQTLFVKGDVSYAWRMEVTLDPAKGTYKFVEYSGKSTTRAGVSPGGAYVRANWTWTRGKSSGQQSMTFVEGSDGQVHVQGPQGPRTSWEGVVRIKPSDAKVPVFTVLRNNGWRPRVDWFGARLFEK
jgi:hypothetical protein